jgi:hypothetical protein
MLDCVSILIKYLMHYVSSIKNGEYSFFKRIVFIMDLNQNLSKMSIAASVIFCGFACDC